jgi:hypothetical protein
VSAVNRILAGELKGYGTIAGKRRTDNLRLIDAAHPRKAGCANRTPKTSRGRPAH